jgi:hypothetical protein
VNIFVAVELGGRGRKSRESQLGHLDALRNILLQEYNVPVPSFSRRVNFGEQFLDVLGNVISPPSIPFLVRKLN